VTDFRKILRYQISFKSVNWEPSFYADGRKDGQTDMTKILVAFRNFANAPKNGWRNYKKVKVWMSLNWLKLLSLASLSNHFHEVECSVEPEIIFTTWVSVYSSKTQITQLRSRRLLVKFNRQKKKNYSPDISPQENPRLSASLFALPLPA
jgi:hypothetical protein